MLWSIETFQNKVSADQYHVTIWAQVWRLPVFSAECAIGMVWGLTSLKYYGTMALWHYGTMAIRC